MESGHAIASRADPDVSNDVCTFCRHATAVPGGDVMTPPACALGFNGYFHSLSQYGAIWVSNCEKGELRPELAALENK
jgi:hypothetical protein